MKMYNECTLPYLPSRLAKSHLFLCAAILDTSDLFCGILNRLLESSVHSCLRYGYNNKIIINSVNS